MGLPGLQSAVEFINDPAFPCVQFGKVLKTTSENMPAEMHDLFLRYKELKKMIKAIPARGVGAWALK